MNKYTWKKNNEWWPITLGYKNIYITLFFLGVKASVVCVCEREREREMNCGRGIQTAILTLNFFSWPYHTVFSSPTRCTQSGATGGLLGPCWLWFSICWWLDKTNDWILQDWPYLMWASAYIISQHPRISAQPCDCFHLFPSYL